MRLLLVILVGGFFAINIYADEIKLANGSVIDGIIKEDGKKVIVETGLGIVEFNRNYVESIQKGKSKLEEYYEKYNNIKDSKNADDFYELAKWAEQNKMNKFVKKLYEKVLELKPGHEGARRALGYQLYQGKWMTQDEVMTAKGFIKFRGKWMTEAEKELIILEEKTKQEEAKIKNQIRQEEIARKKEEEKKRKEKEKNNDYYVANSSWQQNRYYDYYYPRYSYLPTTYSVVSPLNYYYGTYPVVRYSSLYTVPQYNFVINVEINKKK